MREYEEKDLYYLHYIQEYCIRILNYLDSIRHDKALFLENPVMSDAVSMNLLQIGELAGRLTEEYRNKTADQMPWQKMKSMRNLFAHDYIHINMDVVWETAECQVRPLMEFCTDQLAQSSLQEEVLAGFQNPDEIDL